MQRYNEGQLDRTMAALADPTRRAILTRLRGGQMRVTEIAEPFTVSLNAISKHIQVLEKAGLVRRDIRGRDHYLTFQTPPMDAACSWIAQTTQFWNDRLASLEDVLNRQPRRRKTHR